MLCVLVKMTNTTLPPGQPGILQGGLHGFLGSTGQSAAATQGSISLLLPDPENPERSPVQEELGGLAYFGVAG